MRFDITPFRTKFRAAGIEKGVWSGHWIDAFRGCGFSSYKFYGHHESLPHYLSEDEFVVFVLRYS